MPWCSLRWSARGCRALRGRRPRRYPRPPAPSRRSASAHPPINDERPRQHRRPGDAASGATPRRPRSPNRRHDPQPAQRIRHALRRCGGQSAFSDIRRPDGSRPLLHLDGARIYAAITDALRGRELPRGIRKCVICYAPDIISVGFTKIGGMDMDAIVCRDQALAGNLARLVKRQGGLLSKHRYAAAQVIAMLHPDEERATEGRWPSSPRRTPATWPSISATSSDRCPRSISPGPSKPIWCFAKVPNSWTKPLHDRFRNLRPERAERSPRGCALGPRNPTTSTPSSRSCNAAARTDPSLPTPLRRAFSFLEHSESQVSAMLRPGT